MSPCMLSLPSLCFKLLSCECITTSSKTVLHATHFTCCLSSRLPDAGDPGLLGYLFNYFETFHSVHSCSQSLLFIPVKCTSCVKYIYLSPMTRTCFGVCYTIFTSLGRPFCYLLKNCVLFAMLLHRLCYEMENIQLDTVNTYVLPTYTINSRNQQILMYYS
jgi:hypothetical protein